MARTADIISGLQILLKYTNDPAAHIGGAEHDVIYGPPLLNDVSEADKQALESTGWICEEDECGWFHFA